MSNQKERVKLALDLNKFCESSPNALHKGYTAE